MINYIPSYVIPTSFYNFLTPRMPGMPGYPMMVGYPMMAPGSMMPLMLGETDECYKSS